MNKRGFTLVELLAVIVILALLALLTSTAVTKIVKDSKENLSSVQIQNIKEAAEMWGADNLDKLPDAGDCNYITLGVLQDEGLIDNSIIDPKNSEEISSSLKIKISTTLSTSGNLITNYEVNPNSVEGCPSVY